MEPEAEAVWELNTRMRRIGLRNQPGPKPQWKFTEADGKLVRNGKKGGIDWYRHQKHILIDKLIPFHGIIQSHYPGKTVYVMEDGAACHIHKNNKQFFLDKGVLKLLWPGNSPDLNAIEPAWPWLKRKTTVKGPAKTKKELAKRWLQTWEDLPQHQIQDWIERIPRHTQQVLALEGDKKYREGREGGSVRPYISSSSKPRGPNKKRHATLPTHQRGEP